MHIVFSGLSLITLDHALHACVQVLDVHVNEVLLVLLTRGPSNLPILVIWSTSCYCRWLMRMGIDDFEAVVVLLNKHLVSC